MTDKKKQRPDDEPHITRHTMLLPPWADRLPDGTLSPPYGPRSESEFVKAQSAYKQSIEGGGLWDPSEVDRVTPSRKGKLKCKETRYDHEEMSAFVRVWGHKLTTRELEVFFLAYRDGHSLRTTGKRLGVTRDTVKGLIKSLRGKLKQKSERCEECGGQMVFYRHALGHMDWMCEPCAAA